MTHCHDLIVVGLGIMGSAVAWQASRIAGSVLALEAGGPAHVRGSSHGATRIFRQAYWEGSAYLELLRLADAGWRRLDAASPRRLLAPTGGIFIGPRRTGVVAGSLATARAGGIAHEHLDTARLGQRFPQFAPSPAMEAVFEPGAYAVLAEAARLQMLDEAVRHGARLLHGQQVVGLASAGGQVELRTARGDTLRAGAVVVCAGPWAARLLPELTAVTRPHRVPIHWFDPLPHAAAGFASPAFPVFLHEEDDGALLYGIPAGVSAEQGVKIGFHNRQQHLADPDAPAPDLRASEDEITRHVARILPGLVPRPRSSAWCFYTLSDDESFVIDRSPRHPGVCFASACSGHGFKFAPAIGQVLAELALGVPPSADLSRFALSRFPPPCHATAGGTPC